MENKIFSVKIVIYVVVRLGTPDTNPKLMISKSMKHAISNSTNLKEIMCIISWGTLSLPFAIFIKASQLFKLIRLA
jgi:hypothetical protein